jgi:hypothetical protein
MADDKLVVGHEGAGSDCFGKTVSCTGQGLLAGTLIGTVEGCLLPQQVRSSTPLLFKTFNLMGRRGVIGGAVFGSFAAVTCLTASLRDEDDYMNPFIGGCVAGSYFGILGIYNILCHHYHGL